METSMNTKCVQAGYTPKNGEPRQIPIIQSTTFKYDTSEGRVPFVCSITFLLLSNVSFII